MKRKKRKINETTDDNLLTLIQAMQDRSFFLEEFKKSRGNNNILKSGLFIAGALAGAGIIITAGFLIFTPVIAGIIAVGFLAGAALKKLYDTSKIYTDFYKEFESDGNELLIDTGKNKNKFQNKNFISKIPAIRKWESKCFSHNKVLKFWQDKNYLKKIYINQMFEAIRDDNKKKIDRLCNNLPLFESMENQKDEKDENKRTLLELSIIHDYKDIFKTLIKNGADVNAKNSSGTTLLFVAILHGRTDIVRTLIEKGADINAVDENFGTPVNLAIDKEEKDIIKELFENGADVYKTDTTDTTDNHIRVPVYKDKIFLKNETEIISSTDAEIIKREKIFENVRDGNLEETQEINDYMIRIKDKKGRSLLREAAESRHPEIVQRILDSGADTTLYNIDNNTVVFIPNDIGFLIVDALKKREKILQNIQKGILEKTQGTTDYLLRIKDGSNNFLIHIAAASGQVKIFEELLKIGADINARNYNDETPLHLAAYNAEKEMFMALVMNGANIDAVTREGQTLLHKVAFKGHKGIFDTLISMNANVNTKDNYGNTPLHIAAFCSHLEIVKALFKNEADVNAKNRDNVTPLHNAIENSNSKNKEEKKEIVEFLISCGANINVINRDGKNLLHVAAENNNEEAIKILLSKFDEIKDTNKINTKDVINAPDRDRNTPLHIAAENGYTEIIKILLSKECAVIDTINLDNKTPSQLAQESGYTHIAKLIDEAAEKRKRNTLNEICELQR